MRFYFPISGGLATALFVIFATPGLAAGPAETFYECPAGHGGDNSYTNIVIRNLGSRPGSFIIKEIKIFNEQGQLLKSFPPLAFPTGFQPTIPGRGATAFDTKSIFGSQSVGRLSVLIHSQMGPGAPPTGVFPNHHLAVQIDNDASGHVTSRDSVECVGALQE
jgi:hypothetical protein